MVTKITTEDRTRILNKKYIESNLRTTMLNKISDLNTDKKRIEKETREKYRLLTRSILDSKGDEKKRLIKERKDLESQLKKDVKKVDKNINNLNKEMETQNKRLVNLKKKVIKYEQKRGPRAKDFITKTRYLNDKKINSKSFLIDENKALQRFEVTIEYKMSADVGKRKFTISVGGNPSNRISFINDTIREWASIFDWYEVKSINPFDDINQDDIDINDMDMGDATYPKLDKPDAINIDIVENNNCVIETLKYHWKSNFNKNLINQLIKIKKDNGKISVEHLINFFNINNINYKLYNINNQIISFGTSTSKELKPISCYCERGHIYLKRENIPKNYKVKNELVNNNSSGLTKLKEIVNNGFIPYGIKTENCRAVTVTEFIHNKTKYIFNGDYAYIREYIIKLNRKIERECKIDLDKIPLDIKWINLHTFITKQMCKINDTNIKSFLPLKINNLKAYKYTNDEWLNENKDTPIDELIKKFNLSKIDKNKMYPYGLYNLKYLITTNIAINKINKFDISKINDIVDHYLYTCKPKQYTYFMNTTRLYTGEYVKKCFGKIEFEITEEVETVKVENIYHYYLKQYFEVLKDNYNDDTIMKTQLKNIINIHMGCFQKKISYEEKFNTNPIIGEIQHLAYIENKLSNKQDINDNYALAFCDIEHVVHDLMTKLPIAIQIFDAANIMLIEKIEELELSTESIISINTDSILFMATSKQKDLIKDYDPTDFNSWKNEEIKLPCHYSEPEECDFNVLNDCVNFDNSKNVLRCSNAGSGKTFEIKKFVEDLKDSYIILTPTHATGGDYLDENQLVTGYYVKRGIIPKHNVIIIDEIGLCDLETNIFLYKCAMAGKTLYAYGDYSQLVNVEGHVYNNNYFLSLIFGIINKVFINHRNDFTEEYYNDLKTNKDTQYLFNEIKKYSSVNPVMTICYYNHSVDKVNKRKLIAEGKTKLQVGNKLVCQNNVFVKKGFKNNCVYEIREVGREFIYFVGMDRELLISSVTADRNFKMNYATTLYKIQGKSLESYDIYDDDFININTIKRDFNKEAYTIISRLKTK